MEALVDDGLVKCIGISNFSVKKTQDLLGYARIKPVANQVEVHPYFRNSAITEFCQAEVRSTYFCRCLSTGCVAHCLTALVGLCH